MHKIIVLFVLILTVSFAANAQSNSKVDIFAGYSYVRASNNGFSSVNGNGGIVSATYNVTNWIGVVGEFDISHFRVPANAINGYLGANTETYVFGPKLSLFRSHKIAPFVEVLAGGVHADNAFNYSSTYSGSETRLAIVGGGGLDWNVNEHLAVRLAQGDYLWTHLQTSSNNHQNNFRYSTGVVFRF